MNNKGQALGIGVLIMVAITVIVGVILLQSSATNVALTTNTFNELNTTVAFPAAGGTLDLNGQEYISDIVITNATDVEQVPASNYTISETVSTTTGVKTITLTANAGPWAAGTENVNVSYVYGADGYIDDASGRAIAPLVLIFMALAIAIVALVPALRSEVLGRFANIR